MQELGFHRIIKRKGIGLMLFVVQLFQDSLTVLQLSLYCTDTSPISGKIHSGLLPPLPSVFCAVPSKSARDAGLGVYIGGPVTLIIILMITIIYINFTCIIID